MLDDNPKPLVLLIDSGVGGLSICREIRRSLPEAAMLYVADNAWFPYGGRDPQALEGRLLALLEPLCEHYLPDAVVIACNTASTSVLPHLRTALSVPIVGVVPAIKPAARVSHSKVIGLLATPGTVQRRYVRNLINKFASDCQVIPLGSERLVCIVEETLRGIRPKQEELAELLVPLLEAGGPELDTIVLGCTHFPLISTNLAEAAPSIIHWVDSGAAIARHLRTVTASSVRRQSIDDRAFFTCDGMPAHALRGTLANEGFQHVHCGLDFRSGILP